jgi:protein-tyrosine-phosphatase
MHIAFICWGNTCRSPFAQYYAAKRYGEAARFASWGLRVREGSAVSEAAKWAAKELGQISLSEHQAQALPQPAPNDVTIWVAMTQEIADTLGVEWQISPNIVRVWDINDPYGGDVSLYKNTYADIARLVDTLLREQFAGR